MHYSKNGEENAFLFFYIKS